MPADKCKTSVWPATHPTLYVCTSLSTDSEATGNSSDTARIGVVPQRRRASSTAPRVYAVRWVLWPRTWASVKIGLRMACIDIRIATVYIATNTVLVFVHHHACRPPHIGPTISRHALFSYSCRARRAGTRNVGACYVAGIARIGSRIA